MEYRTKLRILNRGILSSLETSKEMFKFLSDQRNANRNNPETPPYINQKRKIKTLGDNTFSKYVQKEEHSCIAGRIANWYN